MRFEMYNQMMLIELSGCEDRKKTRRESKCEGGIQFGNKLS